MRSLNLRGFLASSQDPLAIFAIVAISAISAIFAIVAICSLKGEAMQKLVNPFKPTAGAEPPVLVGRDKVLEDFADGLAEGPGARGRLMRITGPRGSGKTVLLTELGDMARDQGWEVADETARIGLCDRIAKAVSDGSSGSSSVDVHLGVVDLHAESSAPADLSLREALTKKTTELTRQHRGLLITLDEVQDADADEMREIAAAVQHLIREKLNIAFVFAGLTMGVLDLINGKALTFLRHALPEELAAIPLDEIAEAYRLTIERSGFEVDKGALAAASRATVGYAYLIQLVGYQVWRAGKAHVERSRRITMDDVDRGIVDALREFNDAVHESAVADIPLRSLEYLLAMAEDEGVTATATVAERLQLSPSSLTSYRRLLIQRQIIEQTARGYVKFSIPYMREYLLEHRDALLARYGL